MAKLLRTCHKHRQHWIRPELGPLCESSADNNVCRGSKGEVKETECVRCCRDLGEEEVAVANKGVAAAPPCERVTNRPVG